LCDQPLNFLYFEKARVISNLVQVNAILKALGDPLLPADSADCLLECGDFGISVVSFSLSLLRVPTLLKGFACYTTRAICLVLAGWTLNECGEILSGNA
jgi:hypothetical protein